MIYVFAHVQMIVINARAPNCKHKVFRVPIAGLASKNCFLFSLSVTFTAGLVGLRVDLSESNLDEIFAD